MNTQSAEILLVEDNPNDVELTLLAFKRHRPAGRIQVVRDGVEALAFIFGAGAFADRPFADLPKLILLDLKLPKMDGLDVLRRLKDDPRTKAIPVVVLTSSKQDSDVAEAYRVGANSYIPKPVDFDQFDEVVQSLALYWLRLNHLPFREN